MPLIQIRKKLTQFPDDMIRTATADDIDIIQKIAADTWPDTYSDIISKEQLEYMLDLMYSKKSLEEQMQKGHLFYIAEAAGQAVGFASVSREEQNVFKLNKLYVLPAMQKTGAGKVLLNQVISHATNAGGQSLILQVNKKNKAKSFYEKQGFTVIKEQVLELEHGFVMDDYIMGINIPVDVSA